MKRWHVTVDYCTEIGGGSVASILQVEHDIEELDELQDIIERGPSWQAIDKITIVEQRLGERITIEEAARQ